MSHNSRHRNQHQRRQNCGGCAVTPSSELRQQQDGDREQDPPPTEQETQRAHRSEVNPRSSAHRCGGATAYTRPGDDTRAGRPLRPGGHRPQGFADRPVQPALLVLHAGGRAGLAARRLGAHRQRGRATDRHRCADARHPGGPLHRRGAAGTSRPRRAVSGRPSTGATPGRRSSTITVPTRWGA